MSVKETHYIIYGVSLNGKDYQEKYNIEENYDVHSDYCHRKNRTGDIVVVFDGMSNKYAIIGKLIKKTNEFEGISMTAIDKSLFEDKALVKELSEKFSLSVDEIKPQLFIFTHYS